MVVMLMMIHMVGIRPEKGVMGSVFIEGLGRVIRLVMHKMIEL